MPPETVTHSGSRMCSEMCSSSVLGMASFFGYSWPKALLISAVTASWKNKNKNTCILHLYSSPPSSSPPHPLLVSLSRLCSPSLSVHTMSWNSTAVLLGSKFTSMSSGSSSTQTTPTGYALLHVSVGNASWKTSLMV